MLAYSQRIWQANARVLAPWLTSQAGIAQPAYAQPRQAAVPDVPSDIRTDWTYADSPSTVLNSLQTSVLQAVPLTAVLQHSVATGHIWANTLQYTQQLSIVLPYERKSL